LEYPNLYLQVKVRDHGLPVSTTHVYRSYQSRPESEYEYLLSYHLI